MSGEQTKSKERAASRWTRVRMFVFALLVTGLMGLVLNRGHHLHTVRGPKLAAMAERQHNSKILIPAKRGAIVDRHGTPLAVSVLVPSVVADPLLVGGRAAAVKAADSIAPLLQLDRRELAAQLASKRRFVWLKRRVNPTLARRVMALKLPGVRLEHEPKRFYPNNGLGGVVVGFAGSDGQGLEGIELSMDRYLRGKPVELLAHRDARRRAILHEGPEPDGSLGNTVELALDRYIQHEAEQAIAAAAKNVRPSTGWVGVVVLDPATGDVLAMANAPSYNPNRYAKFPEESWRNRTVTDTFEPGSTMKVFSVGAALRAGAIRPRDTFHCENGAWRVGRHTLHDSHGYGVLNISGIIKKSSNIGSAKIAYRLGKERLIEGLKRFGFAQRTGVGISGERAGVLRSAKRLSKIGVATTAFGQGMTSTIMQLAQGLTAMANDGMMMTPRLVRRIKDSRGKTVKQFLTEGRRVLTPDMALELRKMMASVTEEGGTGTNAALDRYTVAGKTGTAQKVDPVLRAYSPELWVSSFIGMVPAIQPRLIIAVVVNEPAGKKYYGGDVAAPVFRRIAERSLGYLGVTPDKAAAPSRKKGKKKAGEAAARAAARPSKPLPPPLPGRTSPVEIGAIRVPDFKGMSIAEVLAKARELGLKVEATGSGSAVSQTPPAGPAGPRAVVRVRFSPPS